MGMETFGFNKAIEALKLGMKVARVGWNGKGMHIVIQKPDEHSKMQQPYIYISPASMGGGLVPWVASHPDLLSEDWYIVD
jgi:hypothetical protein